MIPRCSNQILRTNPLHRQFLPLQHFLSGKSYSLETETPEGKRDVLSGILRNRVGLTQTIYERMTRQVNTLAWSFYAINEELCFVPHWVQKEIPPRISAPQSVQDLPSALPANCFTASYHSCRRIRHCCHFSRRIRCRISRRRYC